MRPPGYFERVRAEAAELWGQLEATPKLKGPWVQLFQQVTNSPEHVLSELLQNADDSGATRASIAVDDRALTVSHNGRDFSASDFTALCGFGASNKGSLHTIGFRGIGFKSAFSVGPRVELRTPTLSVRFQAERFTLPIWDDSLGLGEGTSVRVPLRSPEMRTRLLQYIADWKSAPLSLLFFKNLRSLLLDGTKIGFVEVKPGPVAESTWFSAPGVSDRLLLIRSKPAALPSAAIAEGRETHGDPELSLPPVAVQVVLGKGAEGRLHVVLPTSVTTTLPYACNAPFIQDPARTGIKDPLLSPTNRWLLNQIGRLVGETLVSWAGNAALAAEERAGAYALLPNPLFAHQDSQTVVVLTALREFLHAREFTLGADGHLHAGSSVLLPVEGTRDIWTSSELCTLAASGAKALSHPACSDNFCHRIQDFGGGRCFGVDEVIRRVQESPAPPRPTDLGLRRLWEICDSRLYPSWNVLRFDPRRSSIVPAYGSRTLHKKDQVLRLGDIAGQVAAGDLEFLSRLVPTADLEFATEPGTKRMLPAFSNLLSALELDRPVGVPQLIQKAGAVLGTRRDVEGILRLGRIAGLADVTLDQAFPLVTEAGSILSIKDGALGPAADELGHLFPGGWLEQRRVTTSYLDGMTNEQIAKWDAWASGGTSGLSRFPLPSVRLLECSQDKAQAWTKVVGAQWPTKLPLKYGAFAVEERNFEPELRAHWRSLGATDPKIATEVLVELIVHGWRRLEPLGTERLIQQGNSRTHQIAEGPAAWIRWLASEASIPDEQGVNRYPSSLLVTSPETESLRGIEHFVAARFDQPATRPLLLALGVRASPSDVLGLIERLKAFASAGNPSVEVVAVLCRAIDRLWAKLDAQGREPVVQAFRDEAVGYSSDGQWRRLSELARRNPLKLPAIATIHPTLASLPFLGHCGLSDEPRRGQIIAWLVKRVDAGVLPGTEQEPAYEALRHLGVTGIDDVPALLTLSGELRSIGSLKYLLDHGTAEPILFDHVRRVTARGFADEEHTSALLATPGLVRLKEHAVRRTSALAVTPESKRPRWVSTLADYLTPYVQDQRYVADELCIGRLRSSRWAQIPLLQIELFDGDRRIGPPQPARAVWDGDLICVSGPRVDYERELADSLAQAFTVESLRTVVRRAVGRDNEYIEELFAQLGPARTDAGRSEQAPVPVDAPINVPMAPSNAEDSESIEPPVPPKRHSVAGSVPSSPGAPTGGGATGAVVILGGGSGLSTPRRPRSAPSVPPARPARRPTWVEPARDWLRAEGFVRTQPGKREEFWSHPDGRGARVSRLPVHVMVTGADGAGGVVFHVLLHRPGRERNLPVLHETWETLLSAGSNAYLLVVEAERRLLVPFGRIVRDGASFPSAYMLHLPPDLFDS